jgi:hypothetical protein
MFTNWKKKINILICILLAALILAPANVKADTTQEASSNYYRTQTRTKKGIQEAYSYGDTYEDLGISHTLINVCLNQLLNGSVMHVYNGKTYYFNYIPNLDIEDVMEFNENGIAISVVLLLQRDARSISYNLMYADDNSDKLYYGWNVYDEAAVETLSALMDFLAYTYGRKDCHIDNWIVGNEVNMPNSWNYTGTTDINTNVDIAARSLIIVDNAIKRYNSGARAYLSLDHSWEHNDEGRGISGRTFLDAYAVRIRELKPDADWNIAYHLYSPIMTDSNIWNSRNAVKYTTDSVDTDFISAKNLTVLTDYVKENFGEDVRIILSEQGFTVYNGQEAKAAAALAYTYYAAEFNDMIDAAIFRSLSDDPLEMQDKFYFGLLNSDGSKRQAYDVFKYMDTDEWESYTRACLDTMDIALWNEVVTYFDGERFKRLPLERLSLEKDGIVLAVGYKCTIKYRTFPEFAEISDIQWTSDDEEIVRVDANSGEITALAAGRAIVTAVAGDADYAKCIVVVKNVDESRENVENFVNSLYNAITGENAGNDALQSYTERLMNRSMTGVMVAYELLDREISPNVDEESLVRIMYKALLDMDAADIDSKQLSKYVMNLKAGMSKWRVFADLVSDVRFDYRCYDCDIDTGQLTDISVLSGLNTQSYNRDSDSTYAVVSAFKYMLGRNPSQEELRSYCSELLSGKKDRKGIIESFSQSDEFKSRELSYEEQIDILYELSDLEYVNELVRKIWIELVKSGQCSYSEAIEQFIN